nr:hypothetical protein [uncultured Prevotella sp.]
MKKLVYMAMALVMLIAANGCKNKSNTPVISANDSTALSDENDSTIYGVCGEGTSMHSLELVSDDGDTLSVFIDDENPDIVQGGLLAGDRIALLGYKSQDGEMMAQKIINLTSLLGKWTSLDKNFDLLEGGEVKNNVKAETNPWTTWKILNGKLLLNKDTFDIDKLGSDSLMLENHQGIYVFKRQE